jgi:alpha-galactosidase
MRCTTTLLIAVALGGTAAQTAATPVTVATTGDAAIRHDADASTWTLTAGGSTLVLTAAADMPLQIRQLTTVNRQTWITTPVVDAIVTVDGRAMPLGGPRDGLVLVDTHVTHHGTHLQFDATFENADAGVRVTRHYAITSTVPAFETWVTYEPLGGELQISNLTAAQLTIPNGTVRYVTGLMGDTADVNHPGAFTRRSKTLDPGGHLTLGAAGRSSELMIPWITIDGSKDEFFATLLWSGAWTLSVDRAGDALMLSMGLPPMTTTIRTATDGPHVVYGVTPGAVAPASAAARAFVVQALRDGTPFTPLVTYNTWFAYGTEIDETTIEAEMTRAAALGVELFVMDAGWYAGAGAAGPFDFDAGLGSWEPDPQRFPNGFGALTDYAHSLGLKFGIWVEPERVNLALVGAPGPDEAWLATSGGNYGSDHAGQLCLASDAARAWLLERLSTLIDAARPDYLKWDNNMWINCDRDGHGHGATDGNFAHVAGLYDLLATLRAKYPSLIIENVSGGGNRLDFGMLRYTDVAWMDDRTAPAAHVRHNLEGLSEVFPPAYLLSFVVDDPAESLADPADLSLYMRSRMAGTLGLCFRTDRLSADDTAAIARQIAIYKSVRDTIARASGVLMGSQATDQKSPAWDVLQETASGTSGGILIFAYQSDRSVAKVTVRPNGLKATTTYRVRSLDQGVLGTATGADLIASGIDIVASPASAAHLLVITPQ